jgi:hypothetical protein
MAPTMPPSGLSAGGSKSAIAPCVATKFPSMRWALVACLPGVATSSLRRMELFWQRSCREPEPAGETHGLFLPDPSIPTIERSLNCAIWALAVAESSASKISSRRTSKMTSVSSIKTRSTIFSIPVSRFSGTDSSFSCRGIAKGRGRFSMLRGSGVSFSGLLFGPLSLVSPGWDIMPNVVGVLLLC